MGVPKLASYANENDGDGRYYTHPLTKERLPSVTAVLKLTPKEDLIGWVAKVIAEWCNDNIDKLMSMSRDQGVGVARYRHNDYRNDRAQVGTGVHETIEAEHTHSWQFPELDDEQLLIMEQWRLLNLEWEITPLRSEFTVWITGVSAGTADGLWKFRHRLTGEEFTALVDIKTARRIHPEHEYQLAALAHAPVIMEEFEPDNWREIPAPKYDKVVILHLRAPQWDPYLRRQIEGKHELVYVNDLEENYAIFEGYATTWHALNRLNMKRKKEEVDSRGFAG